ncbi:hypothetical protein B296_00028555 [Ensete ventricosum]|uniref:Uncharacterized protein n=1 Tax=Ensete ventricosum TaxID=4639 RepID=A0A426YWE0_ENSVE|nr:hypothetical protein B296_00028555 [Ensete ventricosum]
MAPSPERRRWLAVVLLLCSGFVLGSRSALAERPLGSSLVQAGSSGSFRKRDVEDDTLPLRNLARSLFGNGSRAHNWPVRRLSPFLPHGIFFSSAPSSWSALGSIGGVGGGGIFVPMLVLIIGFDLKTSAAISKIYGTSTKAFLKGLETWKKETVLLKSYWKSFTSGCSKAFGLINKIERVLRLKFCFAKVPIAAALTLYEAICLYRGNRTITSTGKQDTNWRNFMKPSVFTEGRGQLPLQVSRT